jgi:hypothetical protein
MRERRAQAEDQLIDLAARQLSKWRIVGSTWYNDKDRKRRLAEELSLNIARNPVQGSGRRWHRTG